MWDIWYFVILTQGQNVPSNAFPGYVLKAKYIYFQSQLRNRLALELQGQLADTPQPKSKTISGLFQQISNSLVFDHLQQSQYDYTLSVFITESLTNPEQVKFDFIIYCILSFVFCLLT